MYYNANFFAYNVPNLGETTERYFYHVVVYSLCCQRECFE